MDNFFSALKESEFAILIVEADTGIVRMPNGQRLIGGETECPFLIEADIEKAIEKARKIINENPSFEVSVINNKKELVQKFFNEERIKHYAKKNKKPWWQFW